MQAKQLHLEGNMEEAKRKGNLARRLGVAANISYIVTVLTVTVTALGTGMVVFLWFLLNR